MNRIFILLGCIGTLFLGACGGDSSLPEASGKADVRAINAIKMSQEISFLIEERQIATVPYLGSSGVASYDDLDYTFNFEVNFVAEPGSRRVASQFIDVEANKNYTFLISGDVTSPSISVLQDDVRTFDDADTVFAASFLHADASLGALDYYFADEAIVPVLGNQTASLMFGEKSASFDFPEGDFVLTITTADDPDDLVFKSRVSTFVSRDSYIITSFEGDSRGTAPVAVRAFASSGASGGIPDERFPPTAEFIHASIDLGASDIYDDELLTSLRVSNQDFLGISAELDIEVGANTFYYTPAGETSAVTIETTLAASGDIRYRVVAVGPAGSHRAVTLVPDRRPVDTSVKVLPLQTSNVFPFVDLYAVEPGTSIDDTFPIRVGLSSGVALPAGAIPAGIYDLYVADSLTRDELAGPYRIDVELGDVVDLIIVDTEDPAVLDVLFLAGGPTP